MFNFFLLGNVRVLSRLVFELLNSNTKFLLSGFQKGNIHTKVWIIDKCNIKHEDFVRDIFWFCSTLYLNLLKDVDIEALPKS